MPGPSKTRARHALQTRLRVYRGDDIALGPGKVELLEAIHSTGSIADAAASMGMSYMRAWKLVRTMNACFRQPVVEAVRGGRKHGGASVTPAGLKALELYRAIDQAAISAAQGAWAELRPLLKP